MNIPHYSVRCILGLEELIELRNIATGSEQMSLVQLIIPTEVAHDAVYELGDLGDVQFKDVGVDILSSYTLADACSS